jgi:hypothetical protein
VHDFGVAGDDLDVGLARRCGHRARDAAQQLDRAAFLDDRRARKIKRGGAADREIVDRAAHRELADIAAREKQRVDDIRVGGEREAVAVQREIAQGHACLIAERFEQRIVKGADKDIVDEVLHRLAAAAMRERHGVDRQRAEPAPGDRETEGRNVVHAARAPA